VSFQEFYGVFTDDWESWDEEKT